MMKVVAANMVRTDRSLSGTHLLCAVGRYQEACSQVRFISVSVFLHYILHVTSLNSILGIF